MPTKFYLSSLFIVFLTTCKGHASNDLRLVYSDSSLLAILNTGDKTAKLLDYKTSVAGYLNGQTNEAYLIDLNSFGVTVCQLEYPFNDDHHFKTTNSLRRLIKDDSIEIRKLSKEILTKIGEIESSTGGDPVTTQFSVLNFAEQTKQVVDSLMGPLESFYEGHNSVSWNGEIKFLMYSEVALGSLFKNVDKDVYSLANTKLNLSKISNSKTATEVLLYILQEIGLNNDLGQIFGDNLNSPEIFLDIIAKFNGVGGVDGLLSLLGNMLSYKSGGSSLGVIIQSLQKYTSNPTTMEDLLVVVEEYIALCELQGEEYGFESLDGFREFWAGFLNSDLKMYGVNISEVLSALTSGDAQSGLFNLMSKFS